MARRDEMDAALARHFAWTFVRPGDSIDITDRLAAAQVAEDEAARAPAAPQPPDPAEVARFHAEAAAVCEPLAAAIQQAWALAEGDGQLRATRRLLARAARIHGQLCEMVKWPVEAVRLLRLAARHAGSLTRRQRQHAAEVTQWLPLGHPELAELFVEVARSADGNLTDALLADDGWAPDVGGDDAEDSLVARLADVIDDGPTHAHRIVALDLLLRFPRRDHAAAALRRALRLPSFVVRTRALDLLVSAAPVLVADDDIAFVLRDLVDHPPPDALGRADELDSTEELFAQSVLAALEHAHPDEAEEALLDWIDLESDTLHLDQGWASGALAVAWPEAAAAMVDHWLSCASGYSRTHAIDALERLPPEMAEPRLRLAATDPMEHVREAARGCWLKRFGHACPVGPGDVIGAQLLDLGDRPPSDRFLARLAVMHGRVPEARHAMARALLAEAPDREALVLLLQLVADGTESKEPQHPSGEDTGWARTIVERFGAVGFAGLCAIAARFPEPSSFGWMRRLGDLVAAGLVSRDDAGPLRAIAADLIAHDEGFGACEDALSALAVVGPPRELFDRVVAMAFHEGLDGSWEARKLLVAWPDKAADTRLVSEMALALAERRDALRDIVWVALERRAPAARVLAHRVIEVADDDPEVIDAATECARQLRRAGELGDAWALAALAQPDSPRFTIAVHAWHRVEAVRGALEAALSSTARGGAAAAEAAAALLCFDPPLSVRDRRLPRLLAAAPPVARADVIRAMSLQGLPLALVAPHIEELFAMDDPAVAAALQGVPSGLSSPRGRALLRSLLARVVDPDLRTEVEEALDASRPAYWAED
jgi:hypothetical protein